MRRDPTQFRERFKRWKEGKDVYEAGLPKYDDGTEPNLYRRPNGEYFYTDGSYETPVTPLNKLGDDPSMWTYRDASGKIYQPRIDAANTEVVSQDNNAWTKQRVKEETNRRTWLSDAADIAHGAGEGAMVASDFVPFAGELFTGGKALLNNAKSLVGSATLYGKNFLLSQMMRRSLNKNPILLTYNSSPRYLDTGGNVLDYLDYIKSLFPNSKVKNVVYHTTSAKPFEQFDPSKIKRGYGFYFSPTEHYLPFNRNVFARVNILNPLEINPLKNSNLSVDGLTNVFSIGKRTSKAETESVIQLGNYDGIIGVSNMRNPGELEIVALNPEQIHILGSQLDINQFAGFVRRLKGIESRPLQITSENASKITPEQWTAAQDAAIARGDITEAQRLRDLHFTTNAPNTVVKNVDGTPAHVYHGTFNKGWNSYDKRKFGTSTDNGMYGEGLYATSDRSYADVYARGNNADGKYIGEIKDLYVNGERPFYVFNKKDLSPRAIINREDAAYQFGRTLKVQNDIPTPIWDEMTNSDIIIETKGTKRPNFGEIVVPRGEKIKLADAVTYDNKGVRIPLGERDNFNINDIRYGLLPFGIGLVGYGLHNKNK